MPVVIESRLEDCVGYIVIDSFVNGSSSGDTRIASDVAVEEVAALAREMTFKFRFFRLSRGGAKCGIRVPPNKTPEERLVLLQRFGASVAPLIGKGLYYPGADLGCGTEELAAIYRGAGFALGPQTDTAFFTAMTVGAAVEVCKEHCLGASQVARVAIEGFGKVGAHLAVRLDPARYRIVAVSTEHGALFDAGGLSVPDLVSARERQGDGFVRHFGQGRRISCAEVLGADAEILVPAARTWSIGPDNASGIRARVVVPAANAPYASGALEVLAGKGIVCLPGFVSNAGGVLGSTLKDRGLSEERIEEVVRNLYRPVVQVLVRRSEALVTSPVALAEAYVTDATRFDERPVRVRSGLLSALTRRLQSSPLMRRSRNRRFLAAVLGNLAALPDRLGAVVLDGCAVSGP